MIERAPDETPTPAPAHAPPAAVAAEGPGTLPADVVGGPTDAADHGDEGAQDDAAGVPAAGEDDAAEPEAAGVRAARRRAARPNRRWLLPAGIAAALLAGGVTATLILTGGEET